jgi:hypothetical protein
MPDLIRPTVEGSAAPTEMDGADLDALSDRRRPGRRAYYNTHLITLMRAAAARGSSGTGDASDPDWTRPQPGRLWLVIGACLVFWVLVGLAISRL